MCAACQLLVQLTCISAKHSTDMLVHFCHYCRVFCKMRPSIKVMADHKMINHNAYAMCTIKTAKMCCFSTQFTILSGFVRVFVLEFYARMQCWVEESIKRE